MNSNKSINVQPSRIIGIQFGLLSPESIKRNSVVQIESRDTYINNKPVTGGLFDPRMGVLEPGLICPTDGLTYIDTPGYFGHIKLARPVFFIQHLKEILKIIKCICFKCSKLKINKSQHMHALKMQSSSRWDYVYGLSSNVKRCGDATEDGCGCKQPDRIKQEGIGSIFAIWDNISTEDTDGNKDKTKITMKLTPENIIKIFRRISDDDITFMGFSPIWSRPEWMVCSVLPVPPPAVRPSVKHDAQQRSEDDLTHIYSNIIKTNKDLLDKIQNNASPNVIEGLTAVLQYLVAMIVNNKVKGAIPMSQRSGRPLQCISGRLNSKNGRIRGNLMGKRVDFSARSVITGDPNLSIRQLGVPMKVAKNITKPVVVNGRNRDFLMKLIQNGPDIHPGAKILEKKNGDSISLRYVDRASIRLEDGDIVHRHMMDGDAVLFNRQPSLHRVSMMCHIVKVMKVGDTFRINVGVTKPYNADFDGDEMNMHMPQNVLAETELRHLAAIPYQMISPSGNAPIIGIYQDSMLGSYRFTREKMRMTPRKAMNLLMAYTKVNAETLYDKRASLTNFDVLSQIIPPLTLRYSKGSNKIAIQNGEYLSGQMEKSVLASTSKGIIHRVYNDYGYMPASDFVDDLQGIITEYMKTSSFSVGISDLIANKKTQESILQVVSAQKLEVQSIIQKVHLGIFKNETANSNSVEFEKSINNILNKATEQSGKIGRESLSRDNRFLIIVESGSKGSLVNISQMIACVGQQNVDGKRVPYGFDSRTLPHFTKFDDSETARGFVENSYISGLTAPELFFHAMGGRIGLIDTAVKSVTWETPVVLLEKGKPKYIEIGRWIDGQLADSPDKVQHFAERNMELLNVDGLIEEDMIYIPTTDEDGKVTWGEITAVTRHDPGTELYEIKTAGGRSVTVTESKSLLIWDPETKKLKETATPDIKVGDCVPVTGELCEPPIVLDSVDMTDYLPKDKFVYGSDLVLAVNMMNSAMENKHKIQPNWWNENNGTNFTLPYSKKASLQRLVVRSHIENIKSGFIYPYNGFRRDSCIPDKFELNENNGIFIGLFLADGHCDKSGHITITNNNENIKIFTKSWFDSYSISYKERSKINKIGGLTTTITATSATLTTFINGFVGSKAENKYVPTQAFISNESFAIGLLNGYFSGDGTISKNSIDASSASKRLIEGINMVCSRFGIHGKMSVSQLKTNNLNTKNIKPAHRISIRAHWGKKFSEKITLIEDKKQGKLKQIQWKKSHRNFETYNDVVLDPIVEINIIGVEKHPKVYDLTIPSTLNFGLANGLQVRDTSQTGYIQRRLIKSLEDKKVENDMTVRNNMGKIIQFAYGDDGFDSTKVENQTIPLVGMSIEDIYMHYDLGLERGQILDVYTKGAASRMARQTEELKILNQSYIENMITYRDLLVENIFKFRDENSVSVPVAFHFIIANIGGQLQLGANSSVDITPLEAYELIEFYMSKLEKIYFSPPTSLFRILYNFYLSPRDLLINKRYHRKALELLLETIVLKYKQALVHPGEMVGVIAGQSIGEPTTQLTLNTFHLAGVASKSNVTRGVPRIEEILRLTKNPKNPSLTIHINDEDNQDRATSYATMLEHTKLIDVVKSVQICFDPNENATFIEEDRGLIEQYYEFEKIVNECNQTTEEGDSNLAESFRSMNISGGGGQAAIIAPIEAVYSHKESIQKSKWVIRMEFNAETMLDKNITMDDIHFAIQSAYGQEVSCIYSDFNMENLVFRIRLNSDVLKKKNKDKNSIQSLDQSDEIYLLKNFQDMLLNHIVLRGISGIKNVIPRKLQNMITKQDGKYIKKDIWILDTTGTNLLEALAVDFIDYKRTYSNDIREVFNVLGIEAARQVIYNEFVEVMEFSGVYINYHHLSLLCDRMTLTPEMVPIFRSGLLNDDIGPLAKATFEVHTEVFLDAARHGEFDDMRGVSANVMCGQYGKYGTNMFNVILDMNEMVKLNEANITLKSDADEIEELFGYKGKISGEDACSKGQIEIHSNISTIVANGEKVCDDGYDMGF